MRSGGKLMTLAAAWMVVLATGCDNGNAPQKPNKRGKGASSASAPAAPAAPAPPPAARRSEPRQTELTQDPVYDQYWKAKCKWRAEVADLVNKAKPELKDVTELSFELDFLELDIKGSHFSFLRQSAPSRLPRDKGIGGYINFALSEQELEAWRKAKPSNAEMETNLEALRKRYAAHPRREEYRKFYREHISVSPEFMDAYAKFESEQKAAEAKLKG